MAIKLPEKKYFTFAELKDRWSCEEGDFFHWILDGALVPSYFFEQDFVAYNYEEYSANDGKTDDLWFSTEDGKCGFLYLIKPKLVHAFQFELSIASYERTPNSMALQLIGKRFDFQDVLSECVVMFSEVELMEANALETDTQAIDPKHQSTTDKPLSSKERISLLKIIAVLCKEAKLDYKTHSKTAGFIAGKATEVGIGIGETTIENYLKEIKNVL